jgi:uncharacterized membrane protein
MFFSTALSTVLSFLLWATIIEFLGALLIVFYLLRAIGALLFQRDVKLARFLVADGAIAGLSFKLAGALLRTIGLHTWQQILMFAVIFALRTALKQVFTWERTRVQAQEALR